MEKISIAILDLYAGHANEGMRCIREILTAIRENDHIPLVWTEFDVRTAVELPDTEFDIYISSGGPGSG